MQTDPEQPLTSATASVRLRARFLVIGTMAVLASVLWIYTASPASQLMVKHVVVMNVAAPLAALLLHKLNRPIRVGPLTPFIAVAGQCTLFFLWHTPLLMELAMNNAGGAAIMYISLFAVSLLFWRWILVARIREPWKAILALTLTGKITCLFAVLMVLAPNPLLHGGGHSLADQQAAGLIMLAICPLIYIGTALATTLGWMFPSASDGAARRAA